MITPDHEQQILLPRGITASQAEAYGVRSILEPTDLPEPFHTTKYATAPGLLFVWRSPLAGEVLQLRPDTPVANREGDPVKYVFPPGTTMVLNRLREVDPSSAPLLLCEGTMQSLAAAIYAPEGWAVYGLSGCWNWRKGDTQVATPDLLVAENRDVVIALDADAATNLNVYNAGMALKDALDSEGAASVRFLRLDGHGAKAGLDDVLGARPAANRASYLARLIERSEDKPAKTKPAKTRGGGAKSVTIDSDRPLIMVNNDRFAVINEMTDALKHKWDGTGLFCYGGILAKRSGATVQPVTEGLFADLIAEAALCVSINSKGDAQPGWPDEKSCKATLSRADQFAPLDRIARVPFVRPDGSICQTPGYDTDSATFVVLDETVTGIEVPDNPGEDEVRWAVKLLTEEWLGDLFAIMPEPEDRANCLALMLTPMIRSLVPVVPMAVIDGLQMGVGKNLLADLLSILASGKPAAPLPYSRDDEENKKLITSLFRQGAEMLIFDEAHVIEGRHLARAITGETYSDRILGVSSTIEFPNRVTWVALGNNVAVNADLSRRVYRVRLAPTTANPQDRDSSSFRHPDIKRWTREHRGELVAAALTLIRAWFAGEQVENASGRRFGSFERWGGMVGGILDNAGVDGFLGSLVEWRSETDYDTKFWSDHLAWLRHHFGDEEFSVSEVVKKMINSNHVEHPPRLEDHTKTGYNRSLGVAYAKVKNRIIAGHQLVKTSEKIGHGARWRVLDRTVPAPAETLVSLVQPPQRYEKNVSNTYSMPSSTSVFTGASGSGMHTTSPTSVRPYPSYPSYPPLDGADPLAELLPLCVEVEPRLCPDCDAAEELVPGAHWYACRVCTPRTFTSRE